MKYAPFREDRCAPALVLALHLCSIGAVNAEDPAGRPGAWENVSEAFTRQIGAYDIDAAYPYLRRCQGLIVTPPGDLVMQTAKQGIFVSKDQGATWSVVAGNGIAGRCQDASSLSLAYPYDGRMAFFCYDGAGGVSGGMSLDGARTWTPFSQLKRGVQFADVDWSATQPLTIFGVTHEPYLTVLSEDAGKSWRQLDADEDVGDITCWVGVIDGRRLTRYNKRNGSIESSEDAGLTWTQAAYFRVRGGRPVHYGRKLYWTTSKGVITSVDGKGWTLTGPGAEGACHGPYFGSNDREFIVVTERFFLKTLDGGKSWKAISDLYGAPDIFDAKLAYFGWDSTHDILYASGLGASVYRLRLAPSH